MHKQVDQMEEMKKEFDRMLEEQKKQHIEGMETLRAEKLEELKRSLETKSEIDQDSNIEQQAEKETSEPMEVQGLVEVPNTISQNSEIVLNNTLYPPSISGATATPGGATPPTKNRVQDGIISTQNREESVPYIVSITHSADVVGRGRRLRSSAQR